VTERLTIDHLGHGGDGVAAGGDGPVYVAGALPGETVTVAEVPGHDDRRVLLRVETPSSERMAPICPHFGICGGCALQHWQSEPYCAWKRGLVVTALRQAGIAADVGALIDAHGDGRRRAVFHARATNRVLQVGLSAARAHHIVAIDRCPILSPGLDGALPAAWDIAEALSPLKKPLDIHVTATDSGLDIDVRGSGPLDAGATAALARIAVTRNLARLTRHGELVVVRRAPVLQIGAAAVPLPPAAFLQPTAAGEAALAELVLSGCDGGKSAPKSVADLFAGIGPFALRLAARAQVTAVDDDDAALAALNKAAAATTGLKPVVTERRDLFKNPLTAAELRRFDAVVFDPPRKGADAQARALAASSVPIVIAVSCNPATLARDLRHFIDAGYHVDAVTPVDQFRYSAHVEVVAQLRK
jgi:23S rRNA (uracil1939-C5)-methyltransferase